MDYEKLDEDAKAAIVDQEITNAESEHYRLSIGLEDLPEDQQGPSKARIEVLEKKAARLKRDRGKLSKN